MIRGLLFDLDGTLVDTHRANYMAYKLALDEHGIIIEWDEFKKTIGMQSRQFLPMLAPSLGEEEYKLVRESKAKHYQKIGHQTTLNLPLVNFMKAMASSYKIALITTAQQQSAKMILKQHEIEAYFDIIITAEDVKNHKPSPEGYLQALKFLDLRADEALAFEDSATGIQAAEAAGIKVMKINSFIV